MTNTERIKELKEKIIIDDTEALLLASGNDYHPTGCECPNCNIDIDLTDVFDKVRNRAELQAREECQKEIEQGKQQATKELLEEELDFLATLKVSDTFEKVVLINKKLKELKVQLSKLGEKEK